ncbi:stage III sporulation protein AB [Pelosinus propionicus]|uniref:Stage III sporulation protein AB n=1 Tax=Pelosinus propionicus DSM 13327 TaxID=1123291 RepID=A0A1I4KRL7_9FIRM|nr:stage III sporulation protein AB [Pelosinus propionicus]SFL81390.1 stage III sporulation protein AB [Pelosinus propionicus DSM 13327]
MLKLIGSLLVLLVSSYIGFKMASCCQERPRQLRQLITCIGSLRSHINYSCLPLHEAIKNSTNGIYGPVAEFFQQVASLLEKNPSLTPQEIIKKVLSDMEGCLILKNPEIEVLYVLGGNLGAMNCEEQENYLSLVIEQLERFENEATRLRDLNTKMYRYLGICGGLAIVIILV